MDDELIKFDDDSEVEEFDSVFELKDFDEKTIESLIDDVSSSIDTLENIMINMYYSYNKLKEDSDERINNLVEENEKYCEELSTLYQQLATNSTKEKEE